MATPRKSPVYTKEGLLAADLIELFMREHLVFMKGEFAGKPFQIEPWQRDNIIRPIFGTLDKKGRRKYREAVVGLPRDGGKSEIAAAIALACMFTEPVYEGEYVVVARNRKQAGIVFNKAKRMILRNPTLRAMCDVRVNEIIVKETGARFFTVPWDAGSAQGIHATVAIIDEYHVHRNGSMRYAILSGMIATDGLLITISTAGPVRKGPLWDLLKSAPKDPRAYVYWAGATDDEDGHDPKIWRKANPQSWVTAKMLRDAYRTLPFWEFERYHLNRFPSSGVSKAFNARAWDAGGAVPLLDDEMPTVLGIDASFRVDSTGIVLDQVDDGLVHNAVAWVFESDDGEPVDREAVEALIVALCLTYNVTRVVCDPNHFSISMLKLQKEHGIPVEDFPQRPDRMARASANLYDVIKSKRIRHGGARVLREHVLNAGVQPTPYGWRLTKLEADRKIDAAIALALAAFVAESESVGYSEPRVISA